MKEVTKEHPGSQQVLYMATDLIIANVKKRQPAFLEFSERYTTEFIDSVAAKRTVASQMADEATRVMRHESVRDELVLVAAICLKRFRSLKRYIALAQAFKADPETFWKACQWERYTAAANHSWPDGNFVADAPVEPGKKGGTLLETLHTAMQHAEAFDKSVAPGAFP